MLISILSFKIKFRFSCIYLMSLFFGWFNNRLQLEFLPLEVNLTSVVGAIILDWMCCILLLLMYFYYHLTLTLAANTITPTIIRRSIKIKLMFTVSFIIRSGFMLLLGFRNRRSEPQRPSPSFFIILIRRYCLYTAVKVYYFINGT